MSNDKDKDQKVVPITNKKAKVVPIGTSKVSEHIDKKLVEYIDMTPTWVEITPTLLLCYAEGNPESRKLAFGELIRMAKIADEFVAWQKDNKK